MGFTNSISSVFDFIFASFLLVTCVVPLSLLGIITSAFSAAWALSFATLVYTNLFLSMFWSWLQTSPSATYVPPKETPGRKQTEPPSIIDTTLRPKRSESTVSLNPDTSSATPRDYEGVGGWQSNPLAESDDTQSVFLNMNSRLSVHSPARSRRTSLASRFSGFASPEIMGTPVSTRSRVGHARTPSGSGSLQSYFASAGGSMTALSVKGGRSSVELRESAVVNADAERDLSEAQAAADKT